MFKVPWLTFLVPTALAIGSLPAEAAILVKYNFESGDYSGVKRQYQDKTCSSSSDYIDNSLFDIVDSPGGRSGKAVKHHIQNCDERSELAVTTGTLKAENEYWLGWSMYLPENHNQPGKKSYTIVQQMGFNNACWGNPNGTHCNNLILKEDGSLNPKLGAPINALTPSVDGTSLKYDLHAYLSTDSQGRHTFKKEVYSLPSSPGKWQDFVMYLNLSSDPKQASFKLWKDDKLYIERNIRLLPPQVSSLGAWKIGAYNGEPGNGERLLYTDELRVGDGASSYLDVVNPVRRDKLLGLQGTNSKISSFAADSQLLAASWPASANIVDTAAVPEPSTLVSLLALAGSALSFGFKRR
jgi:Polysaccharide lyase